LQQILPNGETERVGVPRIPEDRHSRQSEAHLRRILRAYAYYYNEIRMHRSLNTDVLVSRPVLWIGNVSHQILGGLHQDLCGFRFSVLTPLPPIGIFALKVSQIWRTRLDLPYRLPWLLARRLLGAQPRKKRVARRPVVGHVCFTPKSGHVQCN
jgi:hypothetical protein